MTIDAKFRDRLQRIGNAVSGQRARLEAGDPTLKTAIAAALEVPESELPDDAFDAARRVVVESAFVHASGLPEYSADARAALLFAKALAARLGEGFDRVPAPSARDFRWIPSRATASDVSGEPTSRTARFTAQHEIGAEVLSNYLGEVVPDEASAHGFFRPGWALIDDMLSPEQAHALAVRKRDALSAIFTAPTLDLADAIRALGERPLADLPRLGEPPTVDRICTKEPPKEVGAVGDKLIIPPEAVSSGPKYRGFFGEDYVRYFNRSGVGEYGRELSTAIVEAVRIAMCAVPPVAAALEASPGFATMKGKYTLQSKATELLQEGIATVGQMLSIVMGKAADGKTADELLEAISDSNLIAQIAIGAPFGVLGPIANVGMIAADPITFNARGSPMLPRGFQELLHEIHRDRKPASADVAPARDHRTQTLTGCPVAVRGPIAGRDGALELTIAPALQTLAAEVIALVRRILREGPPVRAHP